MENSKVLIQRLNLDSMLNYADHYLLFKFHNRKFFNNEAFKTMMHNVWNPIKDVKFFNLQANLFLAQFSDEGDKDRVFCKVYGLLIRV